MKTYKSAFTACLFLLLVFVFPASVLADEWLEIRTKNFNLIGNASEKDIRKVATKLEQFRETFGQLFTQANLNSSIPTNVVVFKSQNSYNPFKPKRENGKTDKNIAGYFQPGEDVNYITLSTEGEDAETYGTIFHEYVHFIVNTNFGKSEVPPWFNEGLAEYYQTFEIEKDQQVKLGLPQTDHLYLLQQNKLIPLETLFQISNYALHQNGNHSRSIFYAQSWALIHYFVQSGKVEGLGKFLTLSMQNVPKEKAIQEAFQMDYKQLEKELTKYIKQSTYKYQMISFKNKLVFDNEMKVSPLSEASSNAYLGDLLYRSNRLEDAEPYLQKALSVEPNSSLANTTFGMIKIRQRKFNEAKNHIEKAISLDQKNHLALYRYAYLLSMEDRDEFGYIASFPAEKAKLMRDTLKKAIALNPGFTESYELLAFVNLVNNEDLDESISYLQKALRYQPGNQRYAIRIAELNMRKGKYDESLAIANKIAQTADEPSLKSQAENLANQIRQMKDSVAQQEAFRKQYETTNAGNSSPTLIRRNNPAKTPSAAETAKMQEEAGIRALNQAIRKTSGNEMQLIGQIQSIECKNNLITYNIKTDTETFTLSTKDFENLALVSFIEDQTIQLDCGAKFPAFNAVLTYQPRAIVKDKTNRGELLAIDFVPKNFHFMDAAEPTTIAAEDDEQPQQPPISAPMPAPQNNADFEAQRREAILKSIKNSMRQVQPGEKRQMGTIEKIECSNKGTFYYLKSQNQIIKLTSKTPQTVQLRAFTPEVEQVRFGCGLKQLDIPTVFTYKESPESKSETKGEILALEFMPKSFVLEQ